MHEVRSFEVTFCMCVFFLFGPAQAEDSLPPILLTALEEAKTAENFDYAYEIEVSSPDGKIIASFDPRLTKKSRWSLAHPVNQNASEQSQHLFKELQKLDSPSTLLVLDDLAGNFSNVKELRESEQYIEYSFQPVPVTSDGILGPLIEPNLGGRVIVQKSPPRLLEISLKSSQSFSIAPLARIDTLEQVTTLRYIPEINGVVADIVKTSVDGSALVSAFVHSETVKVINITPIPKSQTYVKAQNK